jgi:hypothetical protein
LTARKRRDRAPRPVQWLDLHLGRGRACVLSCRLFSTTAQGLPLIVTADLAPAYTAGRQAGIAGFGSTDNPFPWRSPEGRAWLLGCCDAPRNHIVTLTGAPT